MREEYSVKKINLLIIWLRVAFLVYFILRCYFSAKWRFNFLNFSVSAYSVIIFVLFWYGFVIFINKTLSTKKFFVVIITALDFLFALFLSLFFSLFDAVLSLILVVLELAFLVHKKYSIYILLTGIVFVILLQSIKAGFNYALLPFHEIALSVFFSAVMLAVIYIVDLYNQQIKHNFMLLDLLAIGHKLTSALTYDQVIEAFLKIVYTIFPYSCFLIYFVDKEDHSMLKLHTVDPAGSISISDCSTDTPDSVIALAVKEGRPILVEDLHSIQETVIPQDLHLRSMAVIPVFYEGGLLGVFCFANSSPGFILDEDLRIISILANQAAICFRNIQLHETADLLAVTDSVSGLYTQRYFQEQLDNLLIRAKYEDKPLSIIVFDIDFFKQVNDAYGHPQGDYILQQIGALFKRQIRSSDLATRYGGDEFCMVLFDSDKTNSTIIAERIRREVEHNEFIVGTKITRITVSGGVCSFPEDAQTKKELIQIVGALLDEAKTRGRNQIFVG